MPEALRSRSFPARPPASKGTSPAQIGGPILDSFMSRIPVDEPNISDTKSSVGMASCAMGAILSCDVPGPLPPTWPSAS